MEAERSTHLPSRNKTLVLVLKKITQNQTLKFSCPVQFCSISRHLFVNFVRDYSLQIVYKVVETV